MIDNAPSKKTPLPFLTWQPKLGHPLLTVPAPGVVKQEVGQPVEPPVKEGSLRAYSHLAADGHQVERGWDTGGTSL